MHLAVNLDGTWWTTKYLQSVPAVTRRSLSCALYLYAIDTQHCNVCNTVSQLVTLSDVEKTMLHSKSIIQRPTHFTPYLGDWRLKFGVLVIEPHVRHIMKTWTSSIHDVGSIWTAETKQMLDLIYRLCR